MPVIDTCIVLAVLLDEPDSEAARTLLHTGGPLHAPDHLPLEAANALTSAMRRGRISPAGATNRLRMVLDLPITYHAHQPLLPRALHISLHHQRRPFDALFVALLSIWKTPSSPAMGPWSVDLPEPRWGVGSRCSFDSQAAGNASGSYPLKAISSQKPVTIRAVCGAVSPLRSAHEQPSAAAAARALHACPLDLVRSVFLGSAQRVRAVPQVV